MQHLLSPFIYRPFVTPRRSSSGKGLIALAGLTVAGLLLVLARGLLTGNWWFFVMLTWNLFLAFFPLGVVLVLRDLHGPTLGSPQSGDQTQNRPLWFRSRWLLAAGLLVWLVFLPNAPYIITDLYHLKEVEQPLLWFDTMTLFLFALTGLLAGLYSVLVAHRMVQPVVGRWTAWGLMLSSQVLSGFGIYLGRFGRWNSWDLLAQPLALVDALVRASTNHLSLKLTLAYGFVLAVLYIAFWFYVEHTDESESSPA